MSPSHHNNPTTSHVNISTPHHLNLFIILKIVAQGACHRRVFLCRSLEVESVSGVGYSLGCSWSECGDAHVVLLEAGEVLRERLDARRTEEDEHVAVELGCFFLGEVVAHGAAKTPRRDSCGRRNCRP